jgi:glutamate racemase
MHAPYGDKSVDFIIDRVNILADRLIKTGVKALVIACNTATVNAISQLRGRVSVPIIGVEPAIKPAALLSKTKKIAILVTQATSKNRHFKALINRHHNGTEVFTQPCPGLVEMIEQGQQHSTAFQKLLRSYLEPMNSQGIDTIVLGCTHYPLVQKQISAILGDNITIVETAEPVTAQLINKLAHYNLTNTSQALGQHHFFSTESNSTQQQFINQFWQPEVNFQNF